MYPNVKVTGSVCVCLSNRVFLLFLFETDIKLGGGGRILPPPYKV